MSHALLSPSAAHRWLVCTPSARMESYLPDQTSTHALEGSEAHSLAECILKDLELPEHDTEMLKYVTTYTDYVREFPGTLFVETLINLGDIVPRAFGTSDAYIVHGTEIHVFDLKYGIGLKVSARNNPQLMLYAEGLRTMLYMTNSITKVHLHIVQPRLDHISTASYDIDTDWHERIQHFRDKAMQAYTGSGDIVPGDHCQFCKAKYSCPKILEQADSLITESRTEHNVEKLVEIYEQSAHLVKWLNGIEQHLLNLALSGEGVPGYKAVEGQSRRRISDEMGVARSLRDNGFSEDQFTKVQLVGVTELEKLLGKKRFSDLLGEFVERPKGKPVLAKSEDKRNSLNALDDFF